ncbi:RNA helicase required for poly(A+) mRNA export [Dimargaris cristalligena]|uniref:RNA helicase n=1 Tax=Dimargaris cristalligena TaxID=215637 RepID=A0A4Q0A0L1_9FUNG|nr:RNA helicase required for poly(A+) mRNA export [Dimargaris cristalligena]RKP39573.1 cytoplasmic ATP-dependent RNA helicase Dbp5 [Dimargaris cristalligena]|eukprot:RKP39573.1 cytoplasmic ATP-dependent RNA helicase Dbp5 [Dimargaris cristalligena]
MSNLVKRENTTVDLGPEADVAAISENLQDLTAEGKAEGLIDNEHNVKVHLVDQQADPDSPLYSVKSFDELGLADDLLKGVYGMKFTKPSKIQERALPLLLQNPPHNMIGQSQSGTGKTAAFVLAMLSRIDRAEKSPQALCLAPARELARQTMDVVQQMGKFTDITASYAIHEEGPAKGQKVTSQVVIGTPGTVKDLVQRGQLNMRKIKIFVLDEADSMLDQQGLGDQSLRVKNSLPKTCQIVLFSATFADVVKSYAERFAPNANRIMLEVKELSVDGIKQFYMDCRGEDHKLEILRVLYALLSVSQSIIFVRRRDTADRITRLMNESGHAVVTLHGKLQSSERDSVMHDFRSGKTKVLVTTNVLARGIDISQVNMVINYDIPVDSNGNPDPETYLHRIGRTGRFGRTGVAINFVHDKKSHQEMKAIRDHFDREITKIQTENPELMEKTLRLAL